MLTTGFMEEKLYNNIKPSFYLKEKIGRCAQLQGHTFIKIHVTDVQLATIITSKINYVTLAQIS